MATGLSDQQRVLLQALLSGDAAAHRRPGETVEPRAAGVAVPASPEQQHIWLHASMAPDSPIYNEAITVHRDGPFSLEALEKAFNEILRRHESWRMSFAKCDGELRAIVCPNVPITLPLVDLVQLPEKKREKAAIEIAARDARLPFDLSRAPLLRAKVVRLTPEKHRLYLTLHHIIFDGVSIYRLVMPELATLYDAYAHGEQPNLPEPRLQYGDYAVWRQARIATDAMSRELDYWRHRLSGELPELDLPSDRKPPAFPTHRGAMETFQLSRELTARLKEFSCAEGVTFYVLLLTAFKAMLHRYSGQGDIIVGGVTDMRRRPELEQVVGYFLNSVALRTRPSGALSFRDYLADVQSAVVEALDASDVPFDRVVREVAPRRAGARHPLFQVLFSIEPPAPLFAEGWALTQMDVTVGAAKFDLYLELDEQNERLIGRFLYSTDLFEPSTIRRMVGHWTTLLAGAVEAPQARLCDLPLLMPEERRDILIERNKTEQDYPRTVLHAWFEAQARRKPDAIAVECDGKAWCYGELLRRAACLAARLRRAGAGRGRLIAIATERSLEMIAGLLAISKTGAAYLPLDRDLPAARLASLMEEGRPDLVLADRSTLAKLPRTEVPIILCDETGDAEISDDFPVEAVGPDDLAYVLYTSGSTGRPKGVEIRHRSLANLLAAMQREIAFGADDSFLAVTTLSFDIAALELFLPLMSGGRLVIARSEEAVDPSRLASLIERSRCTAMQATPATWRALVACGWPGKPGLKLLCGGEALPSDLAASLLGRGARLLNLYGPTETTIWSLCHAVRPHDDPVPIGRPLANTHVYILDANGAPVPDLVAGELAIGGEGLARCYRNDSELTLQKFCVVPAAGGERLYRTGDLARYRPDGAIEFLGRTDNQVKIRGFRVAIEEVESAIAAYPTIAAVAVRAMPDTTGESSLTAYLVGDRFGEEDVPRLRSFLHERMPDYMVPSRYMLLPALPLTPSGKVDRKRLPLPPAAKSSGAIEPRDALEEKLAEIWREALGRPQIGIEDNFFDLGGHSLMAAVVVAKIQSALGRELPLVALFRSPTVASLAETLRAVDSAPFSHLVALRAGAGRPLFIVHGIFGNVLQFRDLAERLNTSRPVYGVQARGVDPRQEPHAGIFEMVEAYAVAIRTLQPTGPYALAGYSFGGLVAYEIARWLRERGEHVELLALFEADLYARYLPLRDKLAYWLLLARRVVGNARTLPAHALRSYLIAKLMQVGHRVLLRIGWRDDFVSLEEMSGPMAARYRCMYRIGVSEFRAFKPRPYDGKLSIFRIGGPRFDACDSIPIWRRVARSLELFEIAGEHEKIMEKPYVDTLAAQLDRCLAATRSPAASNREMARACERAAGLERRLTGLLHELDALLRGG